jgi:hypothetical protein
MEREKSSKRRAEVREALLKEIQSTWEFRERWGEDPAPLIELYDRISELHLDNPLFGIRGKITFDPDEADLCEMEQSMMISRYGHHDGPKTPEEFVLCLLRHPTYRRT